MLAIPFVHLELEKQLQRAAKTVKMGWTLTLSLAASGLVFYESHCRNLALRRSAKLLKGKSLFLLRKEKKKTTVSANVHCLLLLN